MPSVASAAMYRPPEETAASKKSMWALRTGWPSAGVEAGSKTQLVFRVYGFSPSFGCCSLKRTHPAPAQLTCIHAVLSDAEVASSCAMGSTK